MQGEAATNVPEAIVPSAPVDAGPSPGAAGSPPDTTSASPFPIVALGASAGGLEAIRQILAALPGDLGAALVVVQHLDPERRSLLTNVLAAASRMGVAEAASGMRVERNRVYVIPSDADLSIREGVLALGPRRTTGGLHLPIDSFFRSLAEDQHRHAIGVVLSGSGADGTEGLRAIKAEGGIAIAQAPESAQFRSMPESALSAGVVDFAAAPEQIAREIERFVRHPYVAVAPTAEAPSALDDEKDFASVLAIVRHESGIDFGGYKRTTVRRRIERRMALRHVASLGEYASALRDDSVEARTMAKDMLIHVTAFFRDPEAFDALDQDVFCTFAKSKDEGSTIRIWVPGCSTGEEVYSVAVSLLEGLGEDAKRFSIKIFGSDLSEEAVETARAGVYSDAALADVSPARLSRFFDRAEGGWRVGKRVRELCVFVRHDLTRDPPFAKLDLVCCRNVLIYLDVEMQRRVIPMLHYCLGTPGYLFLGQSETISGFRDLFAPLDKEHRIFTKTGESRRMPHPLGSSPGVERTRYPAVAERLTPAREAQRQAEHLLVSRFAPPGVLVNERLEIVQFRGRTGSFLEPPPGQPDANLLRMARPGLAPRLREAFEQARAQSVTTRQENLRVESETGARIVDLEVVPLAGPAGAGERFFLVLFHDAPESRSAAGEPTEAAPPASKAPLRDAEQIASLKAELAAANDYLRSMVAEHQGTTDDLAAANDELVAANEELQSTNEELQSAKEELQSTNEELNTVNDELRSRNADLDQIANDLTNVLASVDIPVIIVDMGLNVRRFTPTVRRIAGFIPEDVGRPIDDLKLKVKVDDLPERVREVIRELVPKEWEVEGPEGRWFRLQIRPYRTADHRLDGAVLAFVDVDILKRALRDAELARDAAKGVVETVTSALVVLDDRLAILSANNAFYELLGLHAGDVEGRPFLETSAGAWDDPAVRTAFAEVGSAGSPFTGLEVERDLPGLGHKVLSLSGRAILWGQHAGRILVAIDDITGLRALERERALLLESERQARLEAERANNAKDLFLATLSHELRAPLSTILLEAQLLARMGGEDARLERASGSIARAARTQARLIDDLLDVSRIVSGKLLLDLDALDLKEVVQSAVDAALPAAEAKSLGLTLEIAVGFGGTVYGDAIRLQQVFTNLLGNAIKFTPRGGSIRVHLERLGDQARITVVDTGMGIRPEVLPHLFAKFVQADSSVTRTHGGLGLGLAIVRHLVEAHGGEVSAESAGEGHGATFRVTLPIGVARAVASGVSAARDLTGKRVLVVEDDDDMRRSLVSVLEQFGAQVRAAPSAAAGMTALQEFLPDALLSDIAMPGEDGYSFLRRVRGLPASRGGQTPAVALTALASDEDRARAKNAGFQMHLAKPVDGARLAAALRQLAGMAAGHTGDPRA